MVIHSMAHLIGKSVNISKSSRNGAFSIAMLNRGGLSVALLWEPKRRHISPEKPPRMRSLPILLV